MQYCSSHLLHDITCKYFYISSWKSYSLFSTLLQHTKLRPFHIFWLNWASSEYHHFLLYYFIVRPTKSISNLLVVDNPMTSKMVDWKIQNNITRVKIIQYDVVGGVLDYFYTSEEAWIFNPPFLKPLDYHSTILE